MQADVEILAYGPLRAADIAIEWDNGRAALGAEVEEAINARWNRHLNESRQQNRMLFNGPVVRMHAAMQAQAGGRLTLKVAAGDYRSFLVTSVRDRPWFAANAPHAITEALGNSLLLTHRDRVLLGVRSESVASYRGCGHVFGGVLEPREPQPSDAGFILDHLEREVKQEVGISFSMLRQPPRLIALLRDRTLNQPELVWWGELADRQSLGELSFEEHDQLLELPLAGGTSVGEAGALLTPVSRAAIGLLRQINIS